MKLAVLVAAVVVSSSVDDLIRLPEAPLGDGLPADWKVRPVPGFPPPRYSVREEAGQPALHVEGKGAAAWAYRVLESPINPGPGTLRWSWRVLESPAGADLRVPAKDDAALRLYVVFGKSRGLAAKRSRIIFYTWGNAEPKGLTLKSFAFANFRIVRVAGVMEVGGDWREQEVEPFEDYQRFWNRDPPAITAIGIMQDTDMTGGMAISELRSLVWKAR
jgi:hypothetical protein